MFEQHNKLEKILRIIIFALFVSSIVMYVPENSISKDDMIKIVCAVTIVFLLYDFYYPTVKIELQEDKDKNKNK